MQLVKGNYVDNVTVKTKIIEDVLMYFKLNYWYGWRCRVKFQYTPVQIDFEQQYVNLSKSMLRDATYTHAHKEVMTTLIMFYNSCDPGYFNGLFRNERTLPLEVFYPLYYGEEQYEETEKEQAEPSVFIKVFSPDDELSPQQWIYEPEKELLDHVVPFAIEM